MGRGAVNEMLGINSKAMHDKRGLESVIHTIQAEIDEALQTAKNSEEKSKRAMVDAARLADELRAEQDHVAAESRAKRALDAQIGELETRLADAEATAMKGGKNAMAKLEMRIRELEMELGSTQSKTSENFKAFKRAERRVKKLLPLTWLSIARLNKSWRKLRKEANWLEFNWKHFVKNDDVIVFGNFWRQKFT